MMNSAEAKKKRQKRIRVKISGTQQRPRLNVFRSNKYTYGSLVDDVQGKTILAVSEKELKGTNKTTKTEKAFELGKLLAAKAVKKDIKKVIFDRAGYRYHGRVKALAEGAREGGLEF